MNKVPPMDPYRTRPSLPTEDIPAPSPTDSGLHWVIMAVGLLPYLGLFAHGGWSESELGVGTMLILFAGRQLVGVYMAPIGAWLSRRKRSRGPR